MSDTQIFLQVIWKVTKYFPLVPLVAIVGLAWLSIDERRSNHARTKRKTKTSPAKF